MSVHTHAYAYNICQVEIQHFFFSVLPESLGPSVMTATYVTGTYKLFEGGSKGGGGRLKGQTDEKFNFDG